MKKIFSFVAALTLCVGLWAQSVGDKFVDETSGLKFEITAVGAANTVRVIKNNYTGTSYTIPATVSYNDVTFAVTEIYMGAFEKCSSLESITIPAGVTTIGKTAFSGCSSLQSVTIPESVTTIGVGAFYECTSLESITLPAGLTTIENDAFYKCSSLQSVTLPAAVTTIGVDAFFGCDSLQSATLSESLTTIGRAAFSGCSSLQSVTLPEGLLTIEGGAFYNCVAVQSVTFLGNACQDAIGDMAFNGVGSIATPATLVLPNNWTGSKPVDSRKKWYGGYFKVSAPAPEYKYTEYKNWQIKYGNTWEWSDNMEKVEDGLFKLEVFWEGTGFSVKSDENPIKKDFFGLEELVLGEEVIAPVTVDVYLQVIDDETIKIGVGVIPVTDPELTAPQVPTVAAANVKAIMCETYNNDLGYWPQGWGGCSWVDTCKAGVNFKYAKTMAWDCFASDFAGAGAAGYANLHFDIWFAEDGNAPVVKLEFNGTDPTAEITIPGEYKAGWNSVNVNVEETFGEQPMNNLKCLDVKVTKEGGPVAWANILFYNGDYTSTEATGTCAETPVWPEDAPATAPAAPAHEGASILGAALNPSYAFEPLDWPGAMPQLLTFETGETIYYMSKMTWQIYTNWAEDSYDMSGYNMLHVDLYPATGTEIKITIEGLSVDDGGQGYKNSVVKTLVAGQWNGLDIALSEFPALKSGDPYDFSDIRYFTLEGYNAEQTALTVGNVYFYSGPTALPNVDSKFKIQNSKLIINGRLIIRKGNKHFNALGAEVK